MALEEWDIGVNGHLQTLCKHSTLSLYVLLLGFVIMTSDSTNVADEYSTEAV